MSNSEESDPKGSKPGLFELSLTGDCEGISHLAFSRRPAAAGSAQQTLPRDQLIKLAHRIYDSRQARSRFLADSMLGEPVWDMLLALYCLPARGTRLSVTGLCQTVGVPVTTGLRWVQVMEQKRLIERTPDPSDARRVYIRLAAKAEELMSTYLSSIFPQLTGLDPK